MNVPISIITVLFLIIGELTTLITSQKLCEESDIKKLFLPCNEYNQRTILQAKTNECLIEKNNTNLIFPKMQNISCDLKCDKGFRYDYNFLMNKSECLKCGDNSNSEGGSLSMNGRFNQWNKDFTKLKGFKTFCFLSTSPDGEDAEESKDCEPFSVNDDSSLMLSGKTDKTSVQYIGVLLLGFHSRNKGEISFTYKKDTVYDDYFFNGQLIVYMDYDVITQENDLDSPFKTLTRPLEAGDHHILFVYDYWVNPLNEKTKDLKLRIESLEITGVDDAAYECKNCNEGTTQAQCLHCGFNSYLDGGCKNCTDDKFSFASSVGAESCISRPICDEYDYNIISTTACKDGKRKVVYSLTQPSFCDMRNTNSLKISSAPIEETCLIEPDCMIGYSLFNNTCKRCPVGHFSNSDTNYACRQCREGTVPSNIYSISNLLNSRNEFVNTCSSINTEFCSALKGWQFNPEKIYAGKYFSSNNAVTLELVKSVKVFNINSSISFMIELTDLTSEEKFEIKINESSVKNFTKIQGTVKHSLQYQLKTGVNFIIWTYYRSKAAKAKINNPITISNIEIRGSFLGGPGECLECPQGFFVNTTEFLSQCSLCPEGLTANNEKSKCEKCPLNQISNIDRQCEVCPLYTSTLFSSNTCNLNTLIKNEGQKLRYNLSPLKRLLEQHCIINKNTICYNNKFIGPVRDKVTKKDLFFISLFEPDLISLNDFSYERGSEDKTTGHIFGLFEKTRANVKHSDTTYINSNIEYDNVKMLKNLGSSIKKVSIISDKESSNVVRNGLMVEMKEGDVCIHDKSKRYKSYLYLECNRDLGVKAPALVTKIDNECTYLFKWSTDYACRNCLKSELTQHTTPCKNQRQTKIYQDNPNCMIFNVLEDSQTDQANDANSLFDINSEIMAAYLTRRILISDTNITNTDAGVITAIESPYAEFSSEEVECDILHVLDENVLIILICIPVVYLMTVFLLLFLYCKYRRVRREYERLSLSETQSNNKEDSKSNDKRIEI